MSIGLQMFPLTLVPLLTSKDRAYSTNLFLCSAHSEKEWCYGEIRKALELCIQLFAFLQSLSLDAHHLFFWIPFLSCMWPCPIVFPQHNQDLFRTSVGQCPGTGHGKERSMMQSPHSQSSASHERCCLSCWAESRPRMSRMFSTQGLGWVLSCSICLSPLIWELTFFKHRSSESNILVHP